MEEVMVLKDRLLNVISEFVRRRPPRAPQGQLHVKMLLDNLASSQRVSAVEIVCALAYAGYSLSEIVELLYDAGLVKDGIELAKFRRSVWKIMANREICEGGRAEEVEGVV